MSVPANNVIPPHPGVAAAAAAAGPAVRVGVDNTTIPGNPAIAAQIAQARGLPAPQAPQNLGEDFSGDPDGEPNPQADWFGAAATGAPSPQTREPPALPPGAPASTGQPQQVQGQPTYSEIDALLEGIQLPGEAPVQQGAPQAQPQQQPTELPVPQAPPQQVAAPQAPQAPPAFNAEAAQLAAINQLMGREYALSEVDQRKLIAEPETVIPRLAAQVHVNVVRDIGARFGQIVPQIVSQLVEQQLVGVRREAEFFARYPKLAHPALREDVTQSLAMVKNANPNITQEQLFQEGASYAAFRIRQKYRGGVQTPAPMAPQRAAHAPFVPMSPGAPSVQTPMAPSNPFDELSKATDLFDW